MRGDCLSMFLDPWRRTFEFFLHIPFPTLILMCARFFALALHVHEPLTTTWRIRGFPATPQLGWKMSVLRRMHTDALKISKDSNFYELLYDYIYMYTINLKTLNVHVMLAWPGWCTSLGSGLLHTSVVVSDILWSFSDNTWPTHFHLSPNHCLAFHNTACILTVSSCVSLA